MSRVGGISIILLVCAVFYSGQAYADDAIQLSGISWAMASEERVEVLGERGFSCNTKELPDYSTMTLTEVVACRKNDGEILLSEDRFIFSCGVFNACGITPKEFAQEIVNRGYVDSLSPEYRQSTNLIQFCGRGQEGERLCISDVERNANRPLVFLMKGHFGAGDVQFE